MNSVALLLATSLLGVDYQVTDIDGELTYIVRIEEAIAQELVNGFTVSSCIPAEHSDVRRIKIEIVGDSPDETGHSSTPSLNPDPTIIPESTELTISTEIKLEPEIFTLPMFRREQMHEDGKLPPTGDLIPNFDYQAQATDAPDFSEDELVKPATRVMLIDEEAATDASSHEQPRPLESKAVSNDIDLPHGHPSIPPDLIATHQDEFIALASTSSDIDKPNSPTLGQAVNPTSPSLLLPLLFSITLNLFFVFHVIQRSRT